MTPTVITDIVQDLNAGRSFPEILELLHARLEGRIPCNRLAVALYDPVRDTLSLHACRSDGATLLREGYSAHLAGSSLEEVLKKGEPRIINDLEAHLRAHPRSESTRLIAREGLKSSLTLPLVARGRPVGVLFLSARTAGAYTPTHAEFSKLIAGHVSVALERSMLIEELRRSNEYLENILQNSADAIITLDENERIRRWNRGAERMFGYTPAEVIGRDFAVLLPDDLVARGEPGYIRACVQRDGELAGYETDRLTRDGRRLRVNLTTTAIRDREGRAVGRSAILRDMTNLKRLQDDLVRTKNLAAVGELAAAVAHEIKNPLAGISGAIQVISDSFPENDHRRAVGQEILAQVRRLDETVRDLLVFARPWVPEIRPVDLVEVIDRVSSLTAQQERLAHVAIRRESPPHLALRADHRMLQEVLFNLLQNAADATPAGVITVGAAQRNGDVILSVRDTGSGMTPDVRARLFSPFFTTKTRGTGLGLAISRKMIEAHGGSIEIDTAPGKGTEVRVVLPAAGPSEAAPSEFSAGER